MRLELSRKSTQVQPTVGPKDPIVPTKLPKVQHVCSQKIVLGFPTTGQPSESSVRAYAGAAAGLLVQTSVAPCRTSGARFRRGQGFTQKRQQWSRESLLWERFSRAGALL